MDSPAQASEGSGQQEPAKPATTRRRTGGRSARVRAQVLEAVGALLLEAGYDGLTVDAVAERAGVHRTTVYRRWGDVGRLLADVLDAASDGTWSPPDTGSLENDLTALNQEVYEALAGGGPNVTTALIAAGFRSAEAAAALSRFWEDRYARCAVVVTRAADRGELPGPADSRALLVAATAPLYHELLLLRTAPDPTLPRRAAAASAAAARAGAFEGAN
ncbi:TetR/AcrR family transcriptional regulator [Streptomyces sp. Isolate_45]|uniref:TetR/AcrR family transcriptional regulator n=1 Tax=Streptomyces sp. Isolate_45 TaxID=2950111 RepID=UPI002481AB8A|nr:TetR/AcrR family transcriptional regulator [Streptomyces sp. Isolate_45]MDA5279590.1 TetR/AcrR family transcriptional regulator [Streptomyces sp. Isolate_45]